LSARDVQVLIPVTKKNPSHPRGGSWFRNRLILLARSPLVSPQNLVYELLDRLLLGLAPHCNLTLPRGRARQRLSHNPPMHPELLRHAPHRSYLRAILPSDRSNGSTCVSCPSPSRPGWQGQGRPIYRLRWAKSDSQNGPDESSEIKCAISSSGTQKP
jgi:hypothetical protein